MKKITKILKKIVRKIKKNLWLSRKRENNLIHIVGTNNKIENFGIIDNVSVDIIGTNNLVYVSQQSYLHDSRIYIRGNNHKLLIGKNCTINGELWFEDEFCVIEIGDNTTIEQAHIAVTEPNRKIIIGMDCMLSNEIQIRTGDSHSIINNLTNERINKGLDVKIGNHVWIGSRAIILKGVTVGNNSVIGTASVVTKNVEEYTIVAGNPAKQIKSDVSWLRRRI